MHFIILRLYIIVTVKLQVTSDQVDVLHFKLYILHFTFPHYHIFTLFSLSHYLIIYLIFTLTIIIPHPAINNSPPNGVTGPSQVQDSIPKI
jgi:hypothetical protein